MNLERNGEVAVLRMASGKANAIGPAFLSGLNGLMDQLGDARAAVLVGYQSFFCAGLDLPTLLSLDRGQLGDFIQSFAATMLRVFELPLPVVAAINGHAVAGGCVLALQADYRVMVDGGPRIGLNEVQLGIGLPPVVMETLRIQVPPPSLLPIALEGRLFGARDALAVGLLHEIAAPDQLEQRALQKARELAEPPRDAYAQIKAAVRKPASDAVRAAASQVHEWVATWFSAGGQQRLLATVERLSKKR